MATHVGRFTQDQNFNVHFDGSFVGEKTNGSKPQKKGGGLPGRRALRDLTNSERPSGQQVLKKKSQDKKVISVAEDNYVPKAIAEERFLHNHQECLKAHTKAPDRDYFLKTVGVGDDDIWAPPLSPRARQVSSQSNDESPVKLFEMEEELSEMMTGYQSRGHNSPVFGSPKSPKPPYMDLMEDYEFPNFTLMESPDRYPAVCSLHGNDVVRNWSDKIYQI